MSTCTSPTPAPDRPDLTDPWDRTWQHLLRDRHTETTLATWRSQDPVLAPYGDLTTLLAATSRALPQPDADRVLAAVVRRAATEDLGAQVALRRVLPGLLKAAIRRSADGRRTARGVLDELTASAWLVIRTYPCERRPAKVAVNILRDAEYLVFVQPYRLRRYRELPSGHGDEFAVGHAGLDGRRLGGSRHAGEELARVLRAGEEAGVPRADLELLHALYLEAEPVQSVAARLEVSPRTVLNRRLAATERLRELAA